MPFNPLATQVRIMEPSYNGQGEVSTFNQLALFPLNQEAINDYLSRGVK